MTVATDGIAWSAILALGIWHGINPGMGWLFAVALGMQEGRARAVWRALPPLALGHAIAVASALLVAVALGVVIPVKVLQWVVAVVLVAFGLDRLRRSRHPRYGGMTVNAGQLTVWSALMASAHGAGLMVVPFVLRPPASHAGQVVGAVGHAGMAMEAGAEAALASTAVHTTGYLLVAGAVALLVYRKLGVQILRRVWVNLDLIWGVALVATGLATPLI